MANWDLLFDYHRDITKIKMTAQDLTPTEYYTMFIAFLNSMFDLNVRNYIHFEDLKQNFIFEQST